MPAATIPHAEVWRNHPITENMNQASVPQEMCKIPIPGTSNAAMPAEREYSIKAIGLRYPVRNEHGARSFQGCWRDGTLVRAACLGCSHSRGHSSTRISSRSTSVYFVSDGA